MDYICEYGAENSLCSNLLFVLIIIIIVCFSEAKIDWFRFHGQRDAHNSVRTFSKLQLTALRYDQSYGDLRETGRSAYHVCFYHAC
jgi:hypothetical protein